MSIRRLHRELGMGGIVHRPKPGTLDIHLVVIVDMEKVRGYHVPVECSFTFDPKSVSPEPQCWYGHHLRGMPRFPIPPARQMKSPVAVDPDNFAGIGGQVASRSNPDSSRSLLRPVKSPKTLMCAWPILLEQDTIPHFQNRPRRGILPGVVSTTDRRASVALGPRSIHFLIECPGRSYA